MYSTGRSTTSSSAPIVIDATENGDVLVVSSAPFVQGNEFIESGTESDDTCGQSIAYTMYLSKEQQELMEERQTLEDLLEDQRLQWKNVKDQLTQLMKKYSTTLMRKQK